MKRWSNRNSEADLSFKGLWEQPLIVYLRSARTLNILDRAIPYLGDSIYDFTIGEDSSLSCYVQGNGPAEYETTIQVRAGRLYTDCTCPIEEKCKHALALTLALIWEARKRGHEFPVSVTRPYESAFKQLDRSTLEIPEVELIIGEGDDYERPDLGSWWEQVAINSPWHEQEPVYRKVLQERLKGFSFWDINNVLRILEQVRNPIERLKALDSEVFQMRKRNSWRLSGRVEPEPELLAFLNAPETARLSTQFEVEGAKTELVNWLQSVGHSREQVHRLDRMDVLWHQKTIPGGFDRIFFQLRVEAGQRGLLPRKISGILQIARDVNLGNRNFGKNRNRFIHWLDNTHNIYLTSNYQGYYGDDETMVLFAGIQEWLTRWSKDTRWKESGRVTLSPWSATLTLSNSTAAEDLEWVIRIPAYDQVEAREIPLNNATLILDIHDTDTSMGEEFSYFIREADNLIPVNCHGMSPEVINAIRKLGAVPLDALEGTLAGSTLMYLLTSDSSNASLQRWVNEVPCRTEVALALRDGGHIEVTARAKALSNPDMVFCWKPELGWISPDPENKEDIEKPSMQILEESETQTDATAAMDEQLMEKSNPVEDAPSDKTNQSGHFLHTKPRSADVAGLDQWLEQLVSHIGKLTVPADECSMNGHISLHQLLDIWFNRPAGVGFFGNAEFRKLVTIRSAPRISVASDSYEMDWLQVSVTLENEISQTSLEEMSRLLAASDSRFVRLPDGGIYRREDLEAYKAQVDSLNALGLTTKPGEQKLHALHVARAPQDTLSKLEASGGAMTALARKSRKILRDFAGIQDTDVPEETSGFLRPYQRTGVNFLSWSARNFGGALLADDMGLGKTLQMLATIMSLRHGATDTTVGPSLVVCPASVAHNWEREAHRFAPSLKVLVLESGTGRKKHLERLDNYDLVIMNFALLRRDIDTLKKTRWFVIVADEAQAIKNSASESSRAIKQLNGRYRFALTGTPIENRIADLYSIVDFALPGYLGELDKNTSSTDPEAAARACQLLRSRLRPVLMRRLKVEVAPELPERVETRIDCEMAPAQKKLYAAEVKRVRLMVGKLDDATMKGKHRIEILAALMRLRQVCCDPMLLGHAEMDSGKTNELLELIPPLLEAGHKVLVFSQFVKMLNHLEQQLAEKEVKTYKLTGATTNRQKLVDSFENDPDPAAFLISLKAGGTGLNLISASHVILFDPWWNPSVEAQAIDRTHRIGQDKTVVAYRLVTVGTIEERILDLQEKKRALVKNILEEDSFNRTLTRDDFKFLLGN